MLFNRGAPDTIAIMENIINNTPIEINDSTNLVSLQSNEKDATTTPRITQFEDSKEYVSSGTAQIVAHPTMGPAGGDIKEFLSRPVKVYGGLSTAADFQINPLKLYLDNAAVANKTANYMCIRATVCVRYSESAMPFVYGCRQISAAPYMLSSDLRYVHPQHFSHLQCHYTNPSVGNPILMRLPFISNRPYDVIREIRTLDWATWKINVKNVVPYARADVNTAPTNSCSIHVWLEDVVLDIPLATDITWQSEYKGVISVPATAIAKAANVLSSVPSFKPFTTPVEHASTLVAKFASNFGFSRPNQLEPPAIFMDNPDHNMSVSTYLDVAQKMTVDPKQGLNIDSYIVDGNTEDPLSFSAFHSKETLLGTINWTTANTVGGFLETIPVTPCAITSFGLNGYALPASSIPGLSFRCWHGSMKYRFKVICSNYHRGRFRIYWSPTTLNLGAHDIFNELQSTLIDIESDKETVITVNWAQPDYWKPNVYQAWTGGGSNNWNHVNGFLYLRVAQELNAPLSTADIKIMVFVSGGDDLEYFGQSSQNISTFHLMQRGSGKIPLRTNQPLTFNNVIGIVPTGTDWQSMTPGKESTHSYTFNNNTDLSNATLATCGERITSFRELIKCWHLWEAGWFNLSSTNNTLQYISFPSYPLIPGGTTWHTATPNSGFRLYDSPLTLMASVFGAYRGGVRWKIVFDSDLGENVQITAAVVRNPVAGGTAIGGSYTIAALTGGNDNPLYWYHNQGIAVTRSGNSITFEVPYQRSRTFLTMPNSSPIGGSNLNVVISVYDTGSGSSDKLPYRAYVCAAEDTSFALYRGMGMSYAYNVFTDEPAALAAISDETTDEKVVVPDLPIQLD